MSDEIKMVEFENEKTGEVIMLDPMKNYFDPEIYGRELELTDDEFKKLMRESRWLLQNYGYNTEKMDVVLNVWKQNKGWLVNMFKQHPDYNGNYQISFETTVERKISKSGVRKFCNWASNRDLIRQTSFIQNMKADITYEEFMKHKRRWRVLDNLFGYISDVKNEVGANALLLGIQDVVDTDDVDIVINGKTIPEFRTEMQNESDLLNKYHISDEEVFMSDMPAKQDKILNFFYILKDADDQLVTASQARMFNEILEFLGLKMRASEKQKLSKLVSKFCIEIGLSKYVSMQNQSFYDNNGEYHEKEKDMGYNYYFYSVFADSINPKSFKRQIVLSVNPIDFWTMSFGNSWASCMTLDVDKRRKAQGGLGHNYEGMYSSGTESYMLDGSTIVVYYVDLKDENGIGNPELKDKYKRCLFYIGENKMIQSRVYPDGRDGVQDEDDSSVQIAKDMREIVEKVISECAGVPNSWVYKNGTNMATQMSESYGTHYRDYQSYSDCGTVFLKIGERLIKNTQKIKIGHDPICPSCGEPHSNQRNIQCDGCITRDVKTKKLITMGKAFKWNIFGFATQELRDEYVREQACDGNVDDVIANLHELDAEAQAQLDKELFPDTPFEVQESEIETENENTEASDEEVA